MQRFLLTYIMGSVRTCQSFMTSLNFTKQYKVCLCVCSTRQDKLGYRFLKNNSKR